MSFEMALPHPPRIQHVAADGTEQVAQDEQQWALYYTVQRALQQEAAGEEAAGGGAAAQEGGKPAAAAPLPHDPQKVLGKLMTARGELDVITDLITFVEQQQFLAVEGMHRHPASLQERLRARALRLAASKHQLHATAARLGAGLAALQAQSQVDDRFLSDLAQLRRRWKLRRHAGGAAGMFYADIGLPLRGAAAQGVSQDGAQCNIIQDTNGDACIVEAAAGGKPRAVRGWEQIHAVLRLKQRLLAWRVLGQMLAAQARLPRHEGDADRAVAAVQRMAAAAAAACHAALLSAVAGSSSGRDDGGDGEAAAMEVDGASGGSGLQEEGGAAAAAAEAEAALAASALPAGMLSSTALDIQAALAAPGFQQQFESRALLLLAQLLPGGGTGGLAAGQQQQQQQQQQQGVLDSLLQWLRHAALCHRVGGALLSWRDAAGGRSLRRIHSGEEFAAVWQLPGGSGAVAGEGKAAAGAAAAAAPVLVIVQGGQVRVEGGGRAVQVARPAAAAAHCGLSKAELERFLLAL